METAGLLFKIVMYIIGGVAFTFLVIYWYGFIKMVVSYNKPIKSVKTMQTVKI